MNITAIFESWHIGDGNYPPLHKGQLVNLSFEFELENVEKVASNIPDIFEHIGNADYCFCGSVLKVYESNADERLLVIQADGFRFYIADYEARPFVLGNKICGNGTLLLDHYIWVEFLHEYKDAPDLFYNLKVQRIQKVKIPERFIHRHETGKSYPSRLTPKDYSNIDTEELESMEGQSFDEEFYVIDFDGTGLEKQKIPQTFF